MPKSPRPPENAPSPASSAPRHPPAAPTAPGARPATDPYAQRNFEVAGRGQARDVYEGHLSFRRSASNGLRPQPNPPHSGPRRTWQAPPGRPLGAQAHRAWHWLCAPTDTYLPWAANLPHDTWPSLESSLLPLLVQLPSPAPALRLDGHVVDDLLARAPSAAQRNVLLQRLTDEGGPDLEMTSDGEARLLEALDGEEDRQLLGTFLRQRRADPLTAHLALFPAPPQAFWPAAAFAPLADDVKTEVFRQARLVDGTLVQLHYPAFVFQPTDERTYPGPKDAVPGCPPRPLAIRVVPPAPGPAPSSQVGSLEPRGPSPSSYPRMPLLSVPEEVPQGVVYRTAWAAFFFCAQRLEQQLYREPIHTGRLSLAYGWYKATAHGAIPMEPVAVGRRLPALYPSL